MSLPRGLVVGAFVASMVLTSAAVAQQSSSASGAEDDRRLETVVVTGSSIKRKVAESALPIQVLTTEDIRREGINSPEQLISFLNSNGNGLDNLASNADVVGGAQRGNNGA
ncbi:MAG: TonB-dependent receptor, partial [Gammaproteobacteria bacterium]|nr:TonB-dependent receptor [Gammaproteobacteria bacterium]